MQSQPTYSSHQHQQELRGRAIDLDPAKHPRRYAQAKARQRFEKDSRWLQQDNTVAGIERARQVRKEKQREQRAQLAEKLRPLAAQGGTIAGMARALGSTRRHILTLLDEFNIERGPQTRLED